MSAARQLPRSAAQSPDAQSARSLQYLPRIGSSKATVRGSVVLTRPAIYIEDATGGVEVQTSGLVAVKVGDTVEVTGDVSLDGLVPVIRNARILR